MSNPMLATTNSNLDIRVKEPSAGAPPTSGVGPGSPDRVNMFRFKFTKEEFMINYINKMYFDKMIVVNFSYCESL